MDYPRLADNLCRRSHYQRVQAELARVNRAAANRATVKHATVKRATVKRATADAGLTSGHFSACDVFVGQKVQLDEQVGAFLLRVGADVFDVRLVGVVLLLEPLDLRFEHGDFLELLLVVVAGELLEAVRVGELQNFVIDDLLLVVHVRLDYGLLEHLQVLLVGDGPVKGLVLRKLRVVRVREADDEVTDVHVSLRDIRSVIPLAVVVDFVQLVLKALVQLLAPQNVQVEIVENLSQLPELLDLHLLAELLVELVLTEQLVVHVELVLHLIHLLQPVALLVQLGHVVLLQQNTFRQLVLPSLAADGLGQQLPAVAVRVERTRGLGVRLELRLPVFAETFRTDRVFLKRLHAWMRLMVALRAFRYPLLIMVKHFHLQYKNKLFIFY